MGIEKSDDEKKLFSRIVPEDEESRGGLGT
jgi:hypothetical protein